MDKNYEVITFISKYCHFDEVTNLWKTIYCKNVD